MYSKCDAMINLVDHIEDLSYCRIINMDKNRNEAWVQLGENHQLQSKDVVNIQSYDEIKGVLFYQGIVNETTAYKVVVNGLFLVDEKQRRHDVRVQVNIPLILDEIVIGNKKTKPNNKVRMETLNVSASGMLLKSHFNIEEENACLLFDFPLEMKNLNCKAQIVRKQTENGFNLYGCRLLNAEKDRTDLRRFVFKTQIKTRKINFDC